MTKSYWISWVLHNQSAILLWVTHIVEPAFRGSRRRQALEGESSRGLLVASKKEIIGQAALPLGCGRLGAPHVLRCSRVGNGNEWCRVSSFASDEETS